MNKYSNIVYQNHRVNQNISEMTYNLRTQLKENFPNNPIYLDNFTMDQISDSIENSIDIKYRIGKGFKNRNYE